MATAGALGAAGPSGSDVSPLVLVWILELGDRFQLACSRRFISASRRCGWPSVSTSRR